MSPPASVHVDFESKHPSAIRRRLSSVSSSQKPNVHAFSSLASMWAGIAGSVVNGGTSFEIAISVHDSVYSTDFASAVVPYTPNDPAKTATDIEVHVLQTIRRFSTEHLCKFLGAGVTLTLLKECPNLCTRLWMELDVVPIVFNIKPFHTDSLTRPNVKHRISSTTGSYVPSGTDTPTVYVDPSPLIHQDNLQSGVTTKLPIPRTLDEQADSAARKCIMYYGPNNNPRLSIGPRNQVTVDAAGKIHLLDDLEEYRKTVGQGTWNAVIKLADELREKKVKIGFFSSTPQGGGVALMRHALIRFLTALDVDVAWYVPNPSPSVFRTTKNNHNILQGVAAPDLRLTQEAKDQFDAWILKNGLRWTAEGGPLAPGGVDVAFVDDPQMPGLIPLIKKVRPELPIVYRSHIEIRSDLVHVQGSPQEEVWKYLWNNIQLADLFISHPVSKFVPSDVPIEKLALLGAATDWLDGLNKHLDTWDTHFYMGEFRSLCVKEKMNELRWPSRDYVVQIARFDPSKGIPNVIDSYVRFRKLLKESGKVAEDEMPQLLICGHGAVDDPDASIIYDQVMNLINSDHYRDYSKDMVVMRLPPSDQLLNALMANAKIALQLSLREGFEVKVSEALHAGIPVVASRTGGIPLQIEHGKSGYLTDVGDNDAVAKYLYELYTDADLYKAMCKYAATHVSDEVGTVGNAASWMYLAVMYNRGVKIQPKGAWLNDMLREETGELYVEGEPKLPRGGLDMQG
ncbi:glycosyltransferase family 4 protein [Serpula lacrymans var. lacrymans S7.3]|uniref:Glycosyltransferase family 4 protein n=2 Tax=Serpula lacrymans var. lacrymans TaxID=341189 RepID=F8Q7B0_SERL3|nr:glycosyltransferase family 4 protein [Serpula lacrymans var. lacrymans S7.9]EGN95448.1 glycosyltransferase family 4 protein [Serpula lacrymans var. lacrymans S7.3]EGO20978.1 glycosyltransferase family 4 protein [Serpula lacrymans var. lacrymans S7.9]